MFHKEGSIQGTTSNKKGGSHKAVDVPLRKSDRRNLRRRVSTYFWNDPPPLPSSTKTTSNDDTDASTTNNIVENEKDDLTLSSSSQLHASLDEIFLKGNLASRSLPVPNQKAMTMILYLKTPSNSDQAFETSESNTNQKFPLWPYETSTQFVWMAIEEKKKGVVLETPTVALWGVIFGLIHDMSSYSVVIPSAASKYLCRGADLMKAGILQIPSSSVLTTTPTSSISGDIILNKKKLTSNNNASSKSMVAVCVRGNPQPFAVGQCKIQAFTDAETCSLFGPGTKGIGVEIWNCYGDDIWQFSYTKEQCMGTSNISTSGGGTMSYDNGHYGNIGFMDGQYVLPIDSGDNSDESKHGVEGDDLEVSQDHVTSNETDDLGKLTVTDESVAEALSVELNKMPDDEMSPDDVLHYAFCQALVNLKNKELPMLTATFYAQHVLPNRKEGTTINMKDTTYKKFGNYLKEQASRDLIEIGPDTTNKSNTDPIASLISYNKRHEDLQSFSKTELADVTDDNKKKKLILVSLYMTPSRWTDLMRLNADNVNAVNATSTERKGTGMLTGPEARKILDDYIEREGLSEKNGPPGYVNLDGPLTQALYSKKEQQDSSFSVPETLSRKDLSNLFTSKLSPAYALVEMPGSKITKLAKGSPPKVQIEVSRRQSNKFITKVRGLEDYGIDPQYFSKDISRRLAISATVDTDPTTSGGAALRKGHVELIFGANVVDEIEAILVGDETLSSHGGVKNSEYSIPKQVIDVTLKKGVPARKRPGGALKKKK